MLFQLDPKSSEPLTDQLVQKIEDSIAQGILARDEKLPSAEELARELGIHRLTVLASYKELARRGRVSSHPKRGTYIIQDAGQVRRDVIKTLISQAIERGKTMGLTPREIEEEISAAPWNLDFSRELGRFQEWDLFAPASQH